MASPIRIAICDQSLIIRRGLKHILNTDSCIETALEVSSHSELMDHRHDEEIDVILIGYDEKSSRDLEYLHEITKIRPSAKVILLIECEDKQQLSNAIELGVRGFQCRNDFVAEEFIHAIHTVHLGGTSLSNCSMELLKPRAQPQQARPAANLSNREQEVLNLVAMGQTNNDIAENLYISTCTVKFHVSSILSKLKVKNRTEAALWFL
jgi:NarL family two-component system response regulator LiaR